MGLTEHRNHTFRKHGHNNSDTKGRTPRLFFTISSLHSKPSQTQYAEVAARNRVHITCNNACNLSSVTRYEGTDHLHALSSIELKSHVF